MGIRNLIGRRTGTHQANRAVNPDQTEQLEQGLKAERSREEGDRIRREMVRMVLTYPR